MFHERLIKTRIICLGLIAAPSIVIAAQVAPTHLKGEEILDVGAVTLTWSAAKGLLVIMYTAIINT